MKPRFFQFHSMVIIVLIISSAIVHSQDWPQWRGPDRDGQAIGVKVPTTWPSELTQAWKVQVGAGDASPVLAGNKIYVFTRKEGDEVIQCLDAASGKELWQNKYPTPAIAGPSASQHSGPRSTPVVESGKIVTFGIGGVLTCFDAANGKLLWKKENPSNAVPQFFTSMSPLVTGNLVIAFTGTRDNGEIIAFDLSSGKEVWKWSGDGPAYASPVLMTVDGVKQIVAQTEKNIQGLDASNGELLWKIETPPQQRFYNAVSPFIYGRIVIFSGQGTGSKAIKIEKQGSRFVTGDVWSNPDVGAKYNSPVLKDGFLYGLTDGRKIYCISAETGKTAWIDEANHSDFGSAIVCGSVIITLTSTSNLIVFKPGEKEYNEVARYKVSETPVFAHPVISGNNIYIKDMDSLILYKL